jgi:hypothetical protein
MRRGKAVAAVKTSIERRGLGTSRRAGLAGVAVALAAAALGASSGATAASSSNPQQFRVTGVGVVDRASDAGSVLIDRQGGQHVVTVHDVNGSGIAVLAYRTRRAGDKRWTRTTTGRFGYGDDSVTTFLSNDGKFVDVFADICSGVDATRAPVNATHLHQPKRISSADCEGDDASRTFKGAASLPGHQAMALFASASGKRPILERGTPGYSFHRSAALPGLTANVAPLAITRDPARGTLWVLADEVNADGSKTPVLWSRRTGRSWQGPKRIPVHVPAFIASVNSLSVDAGRIAITAFTVKDGNLATPKVVLRRPSGHWRPAMTITHANGKDKWNARAVFNPSSWTLHAVWDQTADSHHKGGIFTERLIHGRWKTYRQLVNFSSGRVVLIPYSVTFTRRGRTVVGFYYNK